MKQPKATVPALKIGVNSISDKWGCSKTISKATIATRAIFITFRRKQMIQVAMIPRIIKKIDGS